MSLYVLMRLLESAPDRYDLGIRLLTLGCLDREYDRLIGRVQPGDRVLDLGCGTGALTLRAARSGASVKGIDVNPHMLDIARRRVEQAALNDKVQLVEMGVADLDSEPGGQYEVITSGLCLSELTDDEFDYTLAHGRRILRPGGLLLVADEVKPDSRLLRVIHAFFRAPLVLITWLVTQQTTHPVDQLPERLQTAGFVVESIRTAALGGFIEVVARKPAGEV